MPVEASGLFSHPGPTGGVILTAKLHGLGEGDTDTEHGRCDGMFLDLFWPPGHPRDSIIICKRRIPRNLG